VAAGAGDPATGGHWRKCCVEQLLAQQHIISEWILGDSDFSDYFAIAEGVGDDFEVEGVVDKHS
jgi:hypothetical protein